MAAAQLELLTDAGSTAAASVRQPAGVLYLLWPIFWVLMVVISMEDHLSDGRHLWWEPLLWEGTSALGATVWLILQRRVDHLYCVYLDRPLRWFGEHLKWLPLLALTFVASVYAIRHGVYGLLGRTYEHESWARVFVYETIKLSLFVSLWLGIIFGLNSFTQWQLQRQRLLSLQRSLAEAQLSQLRAQLRPHFFFNALNTISSLMHEDVARADRLLARLGDLLRSSLQSSEQELVALREELRLLELYAQVMQERFADRVSVAWRIGEDTLNVGVPALLLQPLLENTFKHGVERSRERVQIEIASYRSGDGIDIVIRNTGPVLATDHPEGVGLRNCRERLHVIYGDAACLHLLQSGSAVEARVSIPLREVAR